MQVSAIGIGFYEREDYPRILEIMEDAHLLPRTYDEFVKRFEVGKRQLEARSALVTAAVIKPDEFLAWCRERGLKVDAQARKRFSNEAAIAEVRKRQGGV